jgi:hypothetical protein
MSFPFLPPHGSGLLDDDEEFTVFGDIRSALFNGDRFGKRYSDSLLNCLDQRLLELVSTPGIVLQDLTTDATMMVYLDNGSLVVDDPCWSSVAP